MQYYNRDPKRDHNFDNIPSEFLVQEPDFDSGLGALLLALTFCDVQIAPREPQTFASLMNHILWFPQKGTLTLQQAFQAMIAADSASNCSSSGCWVAGSSSSKDCKYGSLVWVPDLGVLIYTLYIMQKHKSPTKDPY